MTVASNDHQQHSYSHSHPHAHQVHHPHPHSPQIHHAHSMTREQSREHDVLGLRLALGSILSPKRISTPSSRASSGTASPCPAHFGPGLVHPYHHGPSHLHTPIETHEQSEDLKQTATTQETPLINHDGLVSTIKATPQRPSSPARERSLNTPPPILTTSNVHSLSPQQAQSVKNSQRSGHESDTARAKLAAEKFKRERDGKENLDSPRGLNAYIATLQSARAWDALVHGNMS